jgi:CubicO group peptidase (beta-lactamase class C family)
MKEDATTDINFERNYWPTEGWRNSTPEEQGMDSELLAKACAFVQEHELHIHSMLVIRHGHIVADAYFHPFSTGIMHDIASCTKSFTATLIGIAIDKGFIDSVKQPVTDLFPKRRIANFDAPKKSMTLEHLLIMSSGLRCYHMPGEITLQEMFQSRDWVQFTLDLPMIELPGTRFEYCSPCSHILSAIIKENTGMNTLDFARKHLFEPLGIYQVIWPDDPEGITRGWGDLHLIPHDMAKLGFLYLNKGQWNGQQILSPQWIAAAIRKHSSPPPDIYPVSGYGYQWWLATPDIYYADGRGGQMVLVVPENDIIIVFTGSIAGNEVIKRDEMLTSLIAPSVKSPTSLPANPDGVALLESFSRQATIYQTKPKPSPPISRTGQQVSGQTYLLEDNLFRWQDFYLTFQEKDEATFIPTIDGTAYELILGLDNVFRINPGARFGLPALLKGDWEGNNVFTLYWDEVANINRWQMKFTFQDDRVTIQIHEPTQDLGIELNGRLRQ